MDDCINSLDDYTPYAALGANWIYWHMPIAEEYCDKKAFFTHYGAFR